VEISRPAGSSVGALHFSRASPTGQRNDQTLQRSPSVEKALAKMEAFTHESPALPANGGRQVIWTSK
jgi:hypothetical protein